MYAVLTVTAYCPHEQLSQQSVNLSMAVPPCRLSCEVHNTLDACRLLGSSDMEIGNSQIDEDVAVIVSSTKRRRRSPPPAVREREKGDYREMHR